MLCKICNYELKKKYEKVSDINFKMTKDNFDWYECSHCSSLQIKSYNKEENIGSYYSDYVPNQGNISKIPLSFVSNLSIFVNQINKFKKSEKFSLIDLGCGNGTILYNLHLLFPKAKLYGIDYNINTSKNNLSNFPIQLFEGELNEFNIEKKFDFIISSQLLEHMENPKIYTDFLYKFSDNDTIIITDIPNLESKSFKLFGRYWVHLDTPRHRIHYTEKSLFILFKDFELLSLDMFGSNYAYISSFNHFLNLDIHNKNLLRKLIERIIIKLLSYIFNADDKITFTLKKKTYAK